MEATKPVSAADFLEEMFETADEKKALSDFIKQRNIISKLAAIRASKGVTQGEIAKQLKCGQSAVSKLESGVDADLSLAHIHAYAKATGSEVTILMSERGKTLAAQIKMHALSIRHAFLKLVELAHKDDTIAKGVAELHMQAFENINRMLSETASKLPACAENGQPYLSITSSEEVDEEVEEAIPSKKSTQTKRTTAGASRKKAKREMQHA
jgi:transcriptional regulator with XRE-family HTH domain